jgi:ppGpp synthetase/RelA/SpoT-type nucleotidyltranferase
MIKSQTEAILISFLNQKARYKKLAEYIVHLIKDDPSSPKESLHTIIYRIKDELRLIEKISRLNKEPVNGIAPITASNYQARVGDLLGVRIICLRLSDVERIETYIELLAEENILHIVRGPDRKKSFSLPVKPGETIPDDIGLRYSGYSSIHYQVALGDDSEAPSGLKHLLFELQLRTILEEAWSEIDHKYRYVRSRIGVNLPEHIHTGFYNLSAHLQAAALQAEYLCRQADAYPPQKKDGRKGTVETLSDNAFSSTDIGKKVVGQKLLSPEIQKSLKKMLQFEVTPRTLLYIERRLGDFNYEEKPHKTLQKLLVQERFHEFEAIFREILHRAPFADLRERNIDVINVLNYTVFCELQGKRVAQEGLRNALRWRKAGRKRLGRWEKDHLAVER